MGGKDAFEQGVSELPGEATLAGGTSMSAYPSHSFGAAGDGVENLVDLRAGTRDAESSSPAFLPTCITWYGIGSYSMIAVVEGTRHCLGNGQEYVQLSSRESDRFSPVATPIARRFYFPSRSTTYTMDNI